MADHADMGAGSHHGVALGAVLQLVAVPGLADHRREGGALAAGDGEQPGELRLQNQAAFVAGAQFVAGGVADLGNQRFPAGQAGQDALADPARVDLGEQPADLRPGAALTGPAGLADQHHVQPRRVRGSVGDRVGAGSDDVAGGGQEGKEQPGRVGLGLRLQRPDDSTGDAVVGGRGERRPLRRKRTRRNKPLLGWPFFACFASFATTVGLTGHGERLAGHAAHLRSRYSARGTTSSGLGP
jgi:hypothetical protein